MNDNRDSGQFYKIVSWVVETKEQHPNNYDYKWSEKDLAHIKVGLQFMKEYERIDFMERFKDYQIIKVLTEGQVIRNLRLQDNSSIEEAR